MAWFGRKKAAKQKLEPFDYVIATGDRWMVLPQPGERVNLGDWARETVALRSGEFDDADTVTNGDLERVATQLAGWAQIQQDGGPSEWGRVLVVEASFGVEGYITVRGAEFDSSFTRAEDVERYDMHSTPLVGERFTEVVELPAGRAGHSFSVRESSFGGFEGQVRNDDWYVCVEPEHVVILFHAEWVSPGADDMMTLGLREMVKQLEIVSARPRETPPATPSPKPPSAP